MADQPLTPYAKVCVIEKGAITKMYWEHPHGNIPIDHKKVLKRWKKLYGSDVDVIDQRFLNSHVFLQKNVIRDGVRMRD